MPKIVGGYILYARKTLESSIMDKPPLTMKLFTWMLLKANRKNGYRGLEMGQFFTTISDMQEAMSWYIGYRKKTPTKDEIRSCYEALKQATMISTTKTTRGMIVTILNYKTYQDPKNYEGHTETHNDSATIPPTPPHDKQEGVRSTRINNTPPDPKKKKFSLTKYDYPEWVNKDLFLEWAAMRDKIKKPIASDGTVTRAINALKKVMDQGHRQETVIELAIDHNWRSFYPPKNGIPDEPTCPGPREITLDNCDELSR